MPQRHRVMDLCLILQPPEDKINAIGSFLYNIQYFLDSFCMTIKFDQFGVSDPNVASFSSGDS